MKAVRMYSQTLIDVAMTPHAETTVETILEELKQYGKMIQENKSLLQVFKGPMFSHDEKIKTLKKLGEKILPKALTEKFIALLIKRNRIELLDEILKEAEVLLLEKKGGVFGTLLSAVPLEAGVASGVEKELSKKLNKPVKLKEKIDQSLIAGMRVTVGGITFDGTVRSKLDKLIENYR